MSKSLRGRRIVVTRSPEQAQAFVDALQALGADPLVVSAIRFEPLPSDSLDRALAQLRRYDWLLFTSANAVKFFFERVEALGVKLVGPRIAASGSATAARLAARGVTPAFIPAEFVGERLVEGLGDVGAQNILLPRARQGRPEIAQMLRERGAQVDDIPLYDTVQAEPDPAVLATLEQGFDAITFTSPSSVRNFLAIIEPRPAIRRELAAAVIACIGPVTADAARALGLTVTLVPDEYTVPGLVQVLAAHFTSQITPES